MPTWPEQIMRHWIVILALMVSGPGSFGEAQAAAKVRVLETYPTGESITLPMDQKFRIHLAYSLDEPAGIWIEPYFQGRAVLYAGTSPSGYYLGEGEAVAWFFFMRPELRVDEIRITAGNGRVNPVVATYRKHIAAGGASTGSEVSPAWVTELEAVRLPQKSKELTRTRPRR